MKFTTEMLEKAKTAKTAEELLEMAKAENVELTADEAAKYFADLHKSGELSDEELDNVAGGCTPPGVASRPEDVQFRFSIDEQVFVELSSRESGFRATIIDRKIVQDRGDYLPLYKVRLERGDERWVYQSQVSKGYYRLY